MKLATRPGIGLLKGERCQTENPWNDQSNSKGYPRARRQASNTQPAEDVPAALLRPGIRLPVVFIRLFSFLGWTVTGTGTLVNGSRISILIMALHGRGRTARRAVARSYPRIAPSLWCPL